MSSSILQFLLVGSDAGASRAIEKVGASAEVAGAKMAKSAKTSEAAWASVGGAAAKAGKASAVATVAFAAYGVDQAAKFQKLTNVYVTAAGESQKNLKLVQNGVLDIATATGTAWQQVASATYIAEKANLRGADALTVVKASAQGAKEENANLTTVVQGVTSVLASYHLKAGDAVSVTNQLKTASGEAKTTFEDYVGSLSTVLPIASAAKISLADVLGIVSQLTQHGTTANESTQEVAFAIRNLTGGNAVASKEMAQLGIDSVDVAQKLGDGPGGRGLAGTINYLSRTVLGKLGPAGTVLLSTFNASQRAAADAQTEFAALPPQAQKLADAYRKGSVSLKDYRTDLKALPTDQAALVQQFVATENGAKGFQQAIKNGGPAAQTYSQALQKMLGGVNGLNVALQTSGTSSAETAEKIKRISDSAKNSGKDVSGWASTLGLTSTQLDIMKQRAQAVAIHVGQDLLPILDKTLAVLSKHPGILKAVAYGIAGLGAAWTLVKIGNILSGLGRLSAALLGVQTAAARAATAEAGVGVAGAGAAAGAGAGVAEGAAAGGLLARARAGIGKSPLLRIAIPIALAYTFTSATGLNKELSDIIHGQFTKAAQDAPKWAKETASAIDKALGAIGITTPHAKATQVDKILGNPTDSHAIQSVSTLYGQDAAKSFSDALVSEKGNVSKAWQDVYASIGGIPDFFTKQGTVDGQAYGKSVKQTLRDEFPNDAAWGIIDKFQAALKNSRQLLDSNTNALDGNTAGAVSNRKGLEELTTDAVNAAQAYAKTTGHTEDFTNALTLSIPQILDQAAATGLNRDQVAQYLNKLIQIPGFKITTVGLDGTDAAQAQLAAYLQALQAIVQPIRVPVIEYLASVLPAAQGGGATNPLAGPAMGYSPHALGGVARGWALVGEQGPEFIHVGSSSRVLTNRETRGALSGGGSTFIIQALDARSFADFLRRGGAAQIQEATTRRDGYGGNSLSGGP